MINTPIANPRGVQTRTQTRPDPLGGLDLDKLESLLSDLESEHETLLELAGQQRDAICNADARQLGQIVEQTAATLGRIATIEHSRRQVIAQPDGSLPTVDQIASNATPHHAQVLAHRSKSLRELMIRLKDEHEAVRQASLALSNHMNGLIEQVSAKLSHSGTYGRTGAVDPGRQQVVSSLDTRR